MTYISYMSGVCLVFFFFFFNDTATTEIYTLSLHDALPIFAVGYFFGRDRHREVLAHAGEVEHELDQLTVGRGCDPQRSEEHTSELQSRSDLVCRLLLEKKKRRKQSPHQ